jgi:dTDP-4-amino-4,6-dideoxygalactose transaminase
VIPFNKPYLTGKEVEYLTEAVLSGKISGNGSFTKKCQSFFEKKYNLKKTLLTTSCTDALEMAAILIDIQQGDEVIIPSYTFVSSANPFVLRGAKIVFADSQKDHPNIDADNLENLISEKTKAIVPVHYAGVSCDMDKIMELANKYNLYVIEDAAQAVDSFYKGNPLGGIGHLGTFSFHETKNLNCGEGGWLIINDEQFIKRAEIIWEKGTNRVEFHRGEVKKYEWVDIGSSFLPSEVVAAFLYAQINNLDNIQKKRTWIWDKYNEELSFLYDKIELPNIPSYATNNGHLFYLVMNDSVQRKSFLNYMKNKGVLSVFHYQSLHKSPFYDTKHDKRVLINADKYSNQLIRLPLFYELEEKEIQYIISSIKDFFIEFT